MKASQPRDQMNRHFEGYLNLKNQSGGQDDQPNRRFPNLTSTGRPSRKSKEKSMAELDQYFKDSNNNISSKNGFPLQNASGYSIENTNEQFDLNFSEHIANPKLTRKQKSTKVTDINSKTKPKQRKVAFTDPQEWKMKMLNDPAVLPPIGQTDHPIENFNFEDIQDKKTLSVVLPVAKEDTQISIQDETLWYNRFGRQSSPVLSDILNETVAPNKLGSTFKMTNQAESPVPVKQTFPNEQSKPATKPKKLKKKIQLKKKKISPPPPDIHKNAYVSSLSVARSQDLPSEPWMLASRISHSCMFSYFTPIKNPISLDYKSTKEPKPEYGMRDIFGSVRVDDYYEAYKIKRKLQKENRAPTKELSGLISQFRADE